MRAAHRDARAFGHTRTAKRAAEGCHTSWRDSLQYEERSEHAAEGNALDRGGARGDLPPMMDAWRSRSVERLPDYVRLQGRVLFLAEDAALMRRQLGG